jgi:hypothetical protein
MNYASVPQMCKLWSKIKTITSLFNDAANKSPSLNCHLTCIPFKVTSPNTNQSDLTKVTSHHIFKDAGYHEVEILLTITRPN